MAVRFGILCFPGVQQLDLAGPYEVFALARGAEVRLVWKDREPVASATGLWLRPDLRFADSPSFDVICVPGGAGVNALLSDDETLSFVSGQASTARFVTSVCTGALVLGQAGLLSGRKATTHWDALDFLPSFGAIPVKQRVVMDGPVITAGGVTSGIDFGLAVVAELLGQEEAETIQLLMEYDPAPPFRSGSPQAASPAVLQASRARMATMRAEREMLLSKGRGARRDRE